MAAILGRAGVEVRPRPAGVGEVIEDGNSLAANAALKAMAVLAGSHGLPAVADDTGLEVDALDGAPGIHAATFGGPGASYDQNVDALLAALLQRGAVAPEQRRARFRTVALVAWPDGRQVRCEGVVEGHISMARRGGGWGYDPVFVPDEASGRSFGELSAEEKDRISHRGRAFRALAVALQTFTSP